MNNNGTTTTIMERSPTDGVREEQVGGDSNLLISSKTNISYPAVDVPLYSLTATSLDDAGGYIKDDADEGDDDEEDGSFVEKAVIEDTMDTISFIKMFFEDYALCGGCKGSSSGSYYGCEVVDTSINSLDGGSVAIMLDNGDLQLDISVDEEDNNNDNINDYGPPSEVIEIIFTENDRGLLIEDARPGVVVCYNNNNNNNMERPEITTKEEASDTTTSTDENSTPSRGISQERSTSIPNSQSDESRGERSADGEKTPRTPPRLPSVPAKDDDVNCPNEPQKGPTFVKVPPNNEVTAEGATGSGNKANKKNKEVTIMNEIQKTPSPNATKERKLRSFRLKPRRRKNRRKLRVAVESKKFPTTPPEKEEEQEGDCRIVTPPEPRRLSGIDLPILSPQDEVHDDESLNDNKAKSAHGDRERKGGNIFLRGFGLKKTSRSTHEENGVAAAVEAAAAAPPPPPQPTKPTSMGRNTSVFPLVDSVEVMDVDDLSNHSYDGDEEEDGGNSCNSSKRSDDEKYLESMHCTISAASGGDVDDLERCQLPVAEPSSPASITKKNDSEDDNLGVVEPVSPPRIKRKKTAMSRLFPSPKQQQEENQLRQGRRQRQRSPKASINDDESSPSPSPSSVVANQKHDAPTPTGTSGHSLGLVCIDD